tara:strand:- start:1339 stop:1893 length:555 start_codon:yes stop_codon:yes gene_type:complete
MGTPFEDFVNANLGIRGPLYIDTTTPELSSKAAGAIGSKFIDTTTSFLYEKTGYSNADWVKIAEVGDPRGGLNLTNLTGGLNIEISGTSELVNIHTPTTISGHVSVFDYSGIYGTGDLVTLSVSDSGHVGVNTTATDFNFHVSGSSCLSGGNFVLNYDRLPKNNPHQKGRVWVSGSHYLMISSG